jgi:hypothetical protein
MIFQVINPPFSCSFISGSGHDDQAKELENVDKYYAGLRNCKLFWLLLWDYSVTFCLSEDI